VKLVYEAVDGEKLLSESARCFIVSVDPNSYSKGLDISFDMGNYTVGSLNRSVEESTHPLKFKSFDVDLAWPTPLFDLAKVPTEFQPQVHQNKAQTH